MSRETSQTATSLYWTHLSSTVFPLRIRNGGNRGYQNLDLTFFMRQDAMAQHIFIDCHLRAGNNKNYCSGQ